MGAWLQRNLNELEVNLLRSAATVCFMLGLSVQLMPVLRAMDDKLGLGSVLRFPRVRISSEDSHVYVDFGGPKSATHSVEVTFTMTIDEDKK